MENLSAILEAILFVAGDPVRVDDLAHAMNLTVSEMAEALEALGDHLSLENRGIQLNRSGESVFLSIRPAYAPQVEAFLQPLQKRPLSQAVLETLSIIAYRQPCTRGDIESIRGVKCDYSVQSLLTKGFIEECGQRETLGRPTLYRTTDAFLKHFGIETLEDLPTVDFNAPEAGSARRHLLPRLVTSKLSREATQFLSLFEVILCSQFDARCAAVVAACALCMGRAVPADDCCRAWLQRN